MKHKATLVLFTLFLCGLSALAQPGPGGHPGGRGGPGGPANGVIAGSVYDADLRVPVEYANVVVYRQRDSSAVSGGRADAGRTELRQTAVEMPGTEVTADKPKLEFKIDKKIINVAQNPAAQNGTAVDALENAPGVKVDVENNVTLRGSGNFTVLVDGRPTLLEGSEALQQIPAGTIESIEIITNPSAKYDPEGVSGIVNVVLRKQRQSGLSGIVNLSAGLDDKYGGDFLLSLRQGISNSLIGANFNRMMFPGTRTVESWTRSGDTTRHVDSDGRSLFGHQFYGIRAGTELQLGQRDRLSLGGRWGGRGGVRNQEATYYEWTEPGSDTVVRAGHTSAGRGGNDLSANLDFTHNLGRASHDLALRIDYGRHNRDSDDTTEMRGADSAITTGRRTTETGPDQRVNAKLDYALPLRGEDKLEAGYQGRFNWSRDEYRLYEYDTSLGSYQYRSEYSHVSDYTSDVNALYATWSASLARFGFQLGARAEHTGRLIAARDTTFETDRWDVFPGLHLSYKLPADFQLMTSYTRRIDRPRGWDLEPTESWMDAYNVRKGNPGLKNEYIDAVEAGFLWPLGANRVTVEGYYRMTHNLIERVSSLYPGRPGVMLRGVDNVGTDHSLGANLSLELAPFKWWGLTVDGDVYDYRVSGVILGDTFARSSFNWEAGLNSDFRLPTETRFQVRVQYEGPSVEAQGTEGAFLSTNLALRQAFLRRALTLTLQVRDLLSTGGHGMTTEGNGFYTKAEFRRKTPTVTLGLTWNFNNYRPDRRQRPDNGNGEEIETEEMYQ